MLIEAEDLCGHHATGRSAAFWQASLGGDARAPAEPGVEADVRPGWPAARRRFCGRAARSTSPGRAARRSRMRPSSAARRAGRSSTAPSSSSWSRACARNGPGLVRAELRRHRRRRASTPLTWRRFAAAAATVRTDAGARSARRGRRRLARRDRRPARSRPAMLVNAAGAWGDEVARPPGLRRSASSRSAGPWSSCASAGGLARPAARRRPSAEFLFQGRGRP